jgi:hypothetical protein
MANKALRQSLCIPYTFFEIQPRKDHRGVVLISTSYMPNDSARFSPRSL